MAFEERPIMAVRPNNHRQYHDVSFEIYLLTLIRNVGKTLLGNGKRRVTVTEFGLCSELHGPFYQEGWSRPTLPDQDCKRNTVRRG